MDSIKGVGGSGTPSIGSEKKPEPKNGKTTHIALSKIPPNQQPSQKITVTVQPEKNSSVALPIAKLPFKESNTPFEGEQEAEKIDKSEAINPDMQEESPEQECIEDVDDVEDEALDSLQAFATSDNSEDEDKEFEEDSQDENSKKSRKKKVGKNKNPGF